MEPHHTALAAASAAAPVQLKRDALGIVWHDPLRGVVIRDAGAAVRGVRWLALCLARREARALRRLHGQRACPQLIALSNRQLVRSHLPGKPLYLACFEPRAWFRDALRQLRALHARRVAHNDLAKEANWICTDENRAGIVDFQLACTFRRRTRLFRLLAREDLRHLLKHKQHYAPELLSARQRAILAQPAWPARAWRGLIKPPYRLLTRGLLGWRERDGAEERSF